MPSDRFLWPHGEWDSTEPEGATSVSKVNKVVKEQMPAGAEKYMPIVRDFYEKHVKPTLDKEDEPCGECEDCKCGHDIDEPTTFYKSHIKSQVGNLKVPARHCRVCRLPENKPPFPYFGPLCMCGTAADIEPEAICEDRKISYTGYEDIDKFLDECLETMRLKGHDYRQGNDDDLLHNFRTVGEAVDEDMMKVWFTYFFKHYAALTTFVKNGGQSESEPIEGRIKDMIVYLILFYRMVSESKKVKNG